MRGSVTRRARRRRGLVQSKRASAHNKPPPPPPPPSLPSYAPCAAALVAAAAAATTTAAAGGGGALAPPPPQPRAAAPLRDPVAATRGLISRVIGDHFLGRVHLEVIPADPATGRDVFELDAAGGLLVVRANSGVAMASGLGWWLKYWTNSSWSWGREGSGNLIQLTPDQATLPLPASVVRVVSPVTYTYYFNVCTYGYSTGFWGLQQWMEEIDRMALSGVNLPLAFVGSEYVWRRLYAKYGLNATDLFPFFSGPAFLPWQRMGNVRGWGGPLDDDWIVAQRDLQVQLVERMRSFGMTPVLPGFAGHVPNALAALYPAHNFTSQSGWGNFNATYSDVTLLEPTDPLFQQLGADFHAMLLAEYGDPTGEEVPFFNADTFNEMDPSSPDAAYLKACNAAIYQAMVAVDPRAVYVMQAWLFHSGFWNNATVSAYLSGVPIGGMLILDLNTEAAPVWQIFDNFYGHHWVWCVVAAKAYAP